MRAKFLFLAVIASLVGSAFIPQTAPVQANPASFLMSQSLNDLMIEVRLDHCRQVMILELRNGIPQAQHVIEVQSFKLATQTLNVNYIPVTPDEAGYLRTEIPLHGSSVDADIKLTAFAMNHDGSVHQSHYWMLQRRSLTALSDATATYPYIMRELVEESRASLESLNPLSAMSIRYYNLGDSHLYVSAAGHGVGSTAFSSAGTLFSASPSLGMRLSAGPAGVFTAN